MRFKVLKIHNIASIADATIDFTKSPLSDSPIFLICGETGSGKTTILDAICLALYNQTPRLSNNRASADTTYSANGEAVDIKDVRQLIKKGETEASVSLSFISSAGQEYLAEWACRIKRTGSIDKVKWQVSDGTSSPVSEDIAKKMEAIIGLSFDQFCRTSMLAQGQFTEFLKADNKSRSDILEKITGTEVYAEIGKEIHQRHLDADKAFDELNRDLKKIILLSDEEKEVYERTIEALEKEVNENAETMSILKSLLDAIKAIEEAGHDGAEAEKEYEERSLEFKRLSQGLLFEKAQMKDKEAELKELDVWIEARKSKAQIYASIQTIEHELRSIDSLNRTKEEKGAVKKASIAKEEELTVSMKTAKEAEETALSVLSSMKHELDVARKVKAGMNPDEVENARQSIDRVSKAVNEAESTWAGIKAEKKHLDDLQKETAGLDESIEKEKAALFSMKEASERARKDFEEIDAVYQKQKESTDKLVVELRSKLREGLYENGEVVCPVCHSTITTILSDQEVEDSLMPVRKLRDERELLFNKADKQYRDALDTLKIKTDVRSKRQMEYDAALNALKKAEENFMFRFERLGFNSIEEDVEERISKLKSWNEGKKEANEKDLEKIRIQDGLINDLQSRCDAFVKDSSDPAVKRVNDLRLKMIEVEGQIKSCDEALESAEASLSLSKSKLDGIFGTEIWRRSWEAGKMEFIVVLKKEAEEYNGKIDRRDHGLISELNSMSKSVKEHTEIMEEIVAENPAIVNEESVAVRYDGNASMAWGALKTGLEACKRKKQTSIGTICEKQAVLDEFFAKDGTLPHEKTEIESKMQALSDENFTKGQKVGAAKSALEADAKLIREQGEMMIKREELETVRARWTRLNKLFGGDGGSTFRKIAQSYIMQDILNNANKYLSRIAGRYVLTAQPGSLLILVKDKEDGSVRSGNTLSGGEGFIVSLALALGLSSMGENNITVDTIFIDEGFGTLSAELLSSVMSTLEKLNSTSGKNVGIISHIEELQKKIPACIRVTKENATTSSISIS